MTRPVVTVVGLGPGGAEYVTDHTRAEIARVPHRFLRTARHPSSGLVHDAVTFDEVYEQSNTFDDVYAEITERLVAAATEHGEVLYAVPGSPLVLERTVRALRSDPRIECRLHPAMSFLDLAYARLGIDPHDERGMTTTEVAVITFLLVAAAIVVLAVIYNAAKSNVDNIPVPEAPGG